jgi:serine/threonine-protein kinase
MMMAQQNALDRYKVIRELGRGAIGTVYAARDRSTGVVVALKTLDPALFGESDANLADLFLESARSAMRLRHRNIVKIDDAGEVGGTVYVAMELLVGESLRNMLDNRPVSIARAIQVFDDIASALAYAHEEGIVHRGVRPSNIMVLRSGVAKISDFGIGQIGEAARRYMSPEQVRGGPVDHRSDLFSLGALFYEMLTRRALFDGNSPKELMENILHAEPPLPSAVNPHVPSALDGIIGSLLGGHPDERVADARILLRDLQRLEEGLGLGPGTGAGSGEPTARLPPGGAEPRLRTPAAHQSRDREAPHETSSPLRVQTEPAAPQPATEREPGLRTPHPNPSRDPAPMQDALRLDEHDARFITDRGPVPERSSGSRAVGLAALVLMLAVLGLTVFSYYSSGPSEPRTAAIPMQEAPATAAARSGSTAPPPVAEATKEPATAAAAPEASPPRAMGDARAEQESLGIASAPNPLPPKPLAAEPGPPASAIPGTELLRVTKTESLPIRESEQPATAGTAPAQEAPRAPQPRAKISKPQRGGSARLIIAVSPHGELYIDGKHHGTTPPITTLVLEPGMHRIEIRSGSRKPYLAYMVVQAGEQRRIRHDFGAKPSGPPS